MNRSSSREEQVADAAAAAGVDKNGGDVIEALQLVGIGNPTRTQLAGAPGVTAELVRSESDKLNGTGKGAGILVENIRTAAPKAIADADRARRHQRRLRQESNWASPEYVDAVIDGMGDAEIAHWHRQAVKCCCQIDRGQPEGASYESMDPREPSNTRLRYRIVEGKESGAFS